MWNLFVSFPDLCHLSYLYTETVADQTGHFADALVRKSDVTSFENLKLMLFSLEKSSVLFQSWNYKE